MIEIHAFYFDHGSGDFERLASVLRESVALNDPDSTLIMHKLAPPEHVEDAVRQTFIDNSYKLRYWAEMISRAKDGTKLALIDADMVVLRPLADAFTEPFDIAITRRTASFMPYNGGAVFVRASKAARVFFNEWSKVDQKMLDDVQFHTQWRRKYYGINQAALGFMLTERAWLPASIAELPCKIWNACNEDWAVVGNHTRILHIKNDLRHHCLKTRTWSGTPPRYRRAWKLWKNIEAKALAKDAAPMSLPQRITHRQSISA